MNKIKNIYSDFIIKRTYSRWIDELGRRETWDEAVDRYAAFLKPRVPKSILDEFEKAIQAIKDKKIMPSMRLLWTAGKAAEKDNVCAYNCSYTPIDKLDRFHEIMYLLMNGVGAGLSVERQYINRLPEISSTLYAEDTTTYVVADSKEGWALAFRRLIHDWYMGIPSTWDVSEIRPKGSLIKTFGGRASGSEVLVDLFNFTKRIIFNAQGRKLNSVEVADICCKIADIVICGGVRRSALIIFTNLSDQRMRRFKEGQFWQENPQRALANISVAYTEKPDTPSFMSEFQALYQSNSGERGIVNVTMFPDSEMRMNPCGERGLMPQQLCNLTEVVVNAGITIEELEQRVIYATLLGTVQASLTKFNTQVLSKEWIKNTKRDAMLGVSLTGTSNRLWTKEELTNLKLLAKTTNMRYADAMKINHAYGITCNKPSGTVSQVVGCPSGIHPDFSKYYIRRVRVARIDPICQLMIDQGVLYKPDTGTTLENANTMVFEFPMKGSAIRTASNVDALEQLEYYKMFKQYWCDERGNPSCTIYIKENEWFRVQSWVFDNWDYIGGLSYLPANNGVYQLAPYEAISEQEYNKLCSEFPNVDLDKLVEYEKIDTTEGAKTYACTSGSCDIQ